jgi:hypothetical protein
VNAIAGLSSASSLVVINKRGGTACRSDGDAALFYPLAGTIAALRGRLRLTRERKQMSGEKQAPQEQRREEQRRGRSGTAEPQSAGQGIVRDQRGEEQPADKERAQRAHQTEPPPKH